MNLDPIITCRQCKRSFGIGYWHFADCADHQATLKTGVPDAPAPAPAPKDPHVPPRS